MAHSSMISLDIWWFSSLRGISRGQIEFIYSWRIINGSDTCILLERITDTVCPNRVFFKVENQGSEETHVKTRSNLTGHWDISEISTLNGFSRNLFWNFVARLDHITLPTSKVIGRLSYEWSISREPWDILQTSTNPMYPKEWMMKQLQKGNRIVSSWNQIFQCKQ